MREQLRALRTALHLTQAEFAEHIGRDQHWVSRMERGQRLTLDDLRLWAKVCRRELVVLLAEEDTAALVQAVAALGAPDRDVLRRLVPKLEQMPVEVKEALVAIASSHR